jgi:hypothetical protein
MDFVTAHPSGIAVRINGTPYSIPRFLLPQIRRWTAERQQAVADRAVAHLDADGKARFLMYWQPPPVDVFAVADYARTPEGIADILGRQLKEGGVPDDVRAAMLENADPMMLATLCERVTSASKAAVDAKDKTETTAEAGQPADPLSGDPGAPTATAGTGQPDAPSPDATAGSPGSPGTGQTSAAPSTTATAA